MQDVDSDDKKVTHKGGAKGFGIWQIAMLALCILAVTIVLGLIASWLGGEFLFGRFLFHVSTAAMGAIALVVAFREFDRIPKLWQRIALVVSAIIVLVYFVMEFVVILFGI